MITIQQNTGLEDYIETGIPIDADITGELLINIFIPNTPLHDGAVIIRNNRIAVAAAYLPLSDNSMIPKNLGHVTVQLLVSQKLPMQLLSLFQRKPVE